MQCRKHDLKTIQANDYAVQLSGLPVEEQPTLGRPPLDVLVRAARASLDAPAIAAAAPSTPVAKSYASMATLPAANGVDSCNNDNGAEANGVAEATPASIPGVHDSMEFKVLRDLLGLGFGARYSL